MMADCKHPQVAYTVWEYNDYPANLRNEGSDGTPLYELDYSDGELWDSKDGRFYCLDCDATLEGEVL